VVQDGNQSVTLPVCPPRGGGGEVGWTGGGAVKERRVYSSTGSTLQVIVEPLGGRAEAAAEASFEFYPAFVIRYQGENREMLLKYL